MYGAVETLQLPELSDLYIDQLVLYHSPEIYKLHALLQIKISESITPITIDNN